MVRESTEAVADFSKLNKTSVNKFPPASIHLYFCRISGLSLQATHSTSMHSSRMRTARFPWQCWGVCLSRRESALSGGGGGGWGSALTGGSVLAGCSALAGGAGVWGSPRVGQKNACENITFGRFAMRAVKINPMLQW